MGIRPRRKSLFSFIWKTFQKQPAAGIPLKALPETFSSGMLCIAGRSAGSKKRRLLMKLIISPAKK